MKTKEGETRGRPKSETAVSHQAILNAVYELLHETSVRDLTMEAVAKRAGVGKPTLYKWWPSKAALVMDMFEERIVEGLGVPDGAPAEQGIRTQVAEMVRVLNGFFGKVAAEIIAEGQSQPGVLHEYRERYLQNRRAFTTALVERAKQTGEFRADVDAALLIDMIYGPLYYRLLVKHLPITHDFGTELVNRIMAGAKAVQ